MIHDDEDGDDPVALSWIYYICRAKLCLTDKETGRLTLTRFFALYKAYKDTFDLEMRLKNANVTYADVTARAARSDRWF